MSMNMSAITQYYTADEAAVRALKAGADMILMPEDFVSAYEGVLEAVRSGVIDEARINDSLKRVYRVKYAGMTAPDRQRGSRGGSRLKDCRMKRPLVERLAVERLPDERLAVKNCQMVPVHGPAGEQIPASAAGFLRRKSEEQHADPQRFGSHYGKNRKFRLLYRRFQRLCTAENITPPFLPVVKEAFLQAEIRGTGILPVVSDMLPVSRTPKYKNLLRRHPIMSEKRTIAPADKITVAEQYLAGKLTQTSAAKKYQVHIRTIQSWIRLYQVDGPAAFQKHGWTRYPADRKLQAVKAYLDHQGSLDTICTKYGIRTHEVLLHWIRMYNEGKPLRDFTGGTSMKKAKKDIPAGAA